MPLQLPSRPEFQHRENPEMQDRWERPYKYLQSNQASMSQIQLVYQAASCSFPTTLENNSYVLQAQIEGFR